MPLRNKRSGCPFWCLYFCPISSPPFDLCFPALECAVCVFFLLRKVLLFTHETKTVIHCGGKRMCWYRIVNAFLRSDKIKKTCSFSAMSIYIYFTNGRQKKHCRIIGVDWFCYGKLEFTNRKDTLFIALVNMMCDGHCGGKSRSFNILNY